MAKRRVIPEDVATITLAQGAVIYNVGKARLRGMLDNGLGDKIRSYRTSHERRLVLTDVLEAAFPGASNAMIHNMAITFLIQCRDDRVETYGAKREVKRQ